MNADKLTMEEAQKKRAEEVKREWLVFKRVFGSEDGKRVLRSLVSYFTPPMGNGIQESQMLRNLGQSDVINYIRTAIEFAEGE